MKIPSENIILNKAEGNPPIRFKEFIPPIYSDEVEQYLTRKIDGSICWSSIDFIVNNRIKDTDIYYDGGRIGVGRFPLFNYKIDVQIPKNTLITAFHIGDGSVGFSMGNGTTDGFIPEIIGIGGTENDAGLYLVGIANNDIKSNTPLIILDGRNTYGMALKNRPILGITSGNYNDYVLLVDSSQNLNIKGDLIIENLSLLEIIKDLQQQINYLKAKIT